MASVQVTTPTWLSLLQRLGIVAQPPSWTLGNNVVPVAIVDAASVVLSNTNVLPNFGTPASAGELAVPAANTRLADTGALAAGAWTFWVLASTNEGAGGNALRLRRRNAADAADVWSFRYTVINAIPINPLQFRTTLALNERIVIENVAVGGAGSVYQASIFAVAG